MSHFETFVQDHQASFREEMRKRQEWLRNTMANQPEGAVPVPRVVLDMDIKTEYEAGKISTETAITLQLVDPDLRSMLASGRLTREQTVLMHLLRQRDPQCVPGSVVTPPIEVNGREPIQSE